MAICDYLTCKFLFILCMDIVLARNIAIVIDAKHSLLVLGGVVDYEGASYCFGAIDNCLCWLTFPMLKA